MSASSDERDGSKGGPTLLDKPERSSAPKLDREPAFGPRYRVLGILGKGGMGEVYRAYDTELRVECALKIVREEHAGSLARFRREIALARKVTDPHVLRVYDLAEHEGLRFLSMELVDGEDLAALMRREGKLPLERALPIFRQVCTGLNAAHDQGVVHRDLKPQNVLIDHADQVRVADFGLARTIGESGLTASGAVMGSPAYMSPEQVKGEAVDARSDIYSLGVMLFQLVTGETPFRGPSSHAVMEMRLHKPPPRLRELEPRVPAYVEAIAARCLQVDPAQRYPSLRALLAELDGQQAVPEPEPHRKRPSWPIALAGALVAVGVVVAVVVWKSRSQPAAEAPQQHVVAKPLPSGGITKILVLGIANRTLDPTLDALDAVAESALRRSRRLDPIANTGLNTLAAELAPDQPADEKLGQKLAEHDNHQVLIVRGTANTKGTGFVLTLNASDAITGTTVFTRSQDVESRARVVPSLGLLCAGLRSALGETVSDGEQTGLSAELTADHEYALARALHYSDNEPAAASHYQQALAADPKFAQAHAHLAITFFNLARHIEVDEQYKLAMETIDQIGERDRLLMLASYYNLSSGETDRAIAAYQELLAKWPGDLAAEDNLAEAYRSRWDMKHALEAGQRAVHDHSHYPVTRTNLVTYMINAGDITGALAEVAKIEAEFPTLSPSVSLYKAVALQLAGRSADADAAYQRFAAGFPPAGAAAIADRALAEGRFADATKLLEDGIAADRAAQLGDAAELKLAMLAECKLRRGDRAGALAAAAGVTREPRHLFMAAMVQLAGGDDKHALASAAALADRPALEPRALAKLIEAEVAREHGKLDHAIAVLRDAMRIDDLWLGHLLLARTLAQAGKHVEAIAELRICETRRGEMALGIDDTPGLRYIPQVGYYLGLELEATGDRPAARAAFVAFVAAQPHADHNALLDDARARSK